MLSTRDKILLALQSGKTVSGADLAVRLKVTRALVWKHIQEMRKQGFRIESSKKDGYRLADAFDFSLLRASRKMKTWTLHYQFETASTQILAKAAAEEGVLASQLWIAEKQSSARGRLQRVWDSKLGGLWFSMLLRPSISPGRIPPLTLVVASALADAIRKTTKQEVRLKWPNDVVIRAPGGWRKVAGILTDMSAELDRTHWVVIGIGINVNNVLAPDLESIAATLGAQTGRLLSRAEILQSFLTEFEKAYKPFQLKGFEPFQESYWKNYSRPDEPVAIQTAQGTVAGIARGVDARGALIVESHNEKKYIWEGEIVS